LNIGYLTPVLRSPYLHATEKGNRKRFYNGAIQKFKTV